MKNRILIGLAVVGVVVGCSRSPIPPDDFDVRTATLQEIQKYPEEALRQRERIARVAESNSRLLQRQLEIRAELRASEEVERQRHDPGVGDF